jgi:7-carboxy-7-deazaguanine synthase
LRISELFYSIQGEGPAMGMPATFVRFAGCNLSCIGCDTQLKEWKEISSNCVLDQIRGKRVIITGGEPTMQMAGLLELINLLSDNSIEIHLETNGTGRIPEDELSRLHLVVVSPKYGSNIDFNFWVCKENVHFKFVLGAADWCWPVEFIEQLVDILPKERTWIMPLGIDQDLPLAKISWDLAIRLGVNYSDRLHIRLRKR